MSRLTSYKWKDALVMAITSRHSWHEYLCIFLKICYMLTFGTGQYHRAAESESVEVEHFGGSLRTGVGKIVNYDSYQSRIPSATCQWTIISSEFNRLMTQKVSRIF